MASDEEFFDPYETIEQIHKSRPSPPDTLQIFNTDPPPLQRVSKFPDSSDFRTDISLSARKTELFSWTTQNLIQKKNKSTKEFSGLEIIQELHLSSDSKRNWVMKFSPSFAYISLAGESSLIFLFKISGNFSEQNKNILEEPEEYTGHSQSVISIEWAASSEFFISCGADCLVLLWKVGKFTPVKQFVQNNIATCAGFNPIHFDVFFTGSLSKQICLWSLSEAQVENVYQALGLITAGSYSPNGAMLAIGLSNGECMIYESHHTVLTFLTKIHCKNRKGFKSSGKKVTGLEFQDDQYLLITTNDSRIRLYSLANFNILQKYKGGKCEQFPIRASFSHNFSHVIRGSEDGKVVIWNTFVEAKKKGGGLKNESIEYFAVEKKKTMSDAVFAPDGLVKMIQQGYLESGSEVIVSHALVGNANGVVKVYFNQFKNVPW